MVLINVGLSVIAGIVYGIIFTVIKSYTLTNSDQHKKPAWLIYALDLLRSLFFMLILLYLLRISQVHFILVTSVMVITFLLTVLSYVTVLKKYD